MPFVPSLRLSALALLLLTVAGSAAADPATDCQDRELELEPLLAACTAALEVADPAVQGDLLADRAWVYRQLGDLEAARADIEEAIRLAPGDADGWIERGHTLRAEGDLAGAVVALERAVEVEPDYPRALLVAMDVQADAGEIERCLELASTAVEVAPERPHTWHFRGRCLAEANRDEEAIADYLKAVEIGLEDSHLHSNLALAYGRLGRHAEAEPAARQAIAIDPANWLGQLALVEALIHQDRLEDALAAYEAGEAAIPPEEIDLANDVAWTLHLAGRHAEALSVIEPWIAAHPDLTPDQVYEMDTFAHVLAAVGRSEEAAEAYLRAAEIGGSEKRAVYEESLRKLGFDPGGDDAAFAAALQACAQTGAACRLDV